MVEWTLSPLLLGRDAVLLLLPLVLEPGVSWEYPRKVLEEELLSYYKAHCCLVGSCVLTLFPLAQVFMLVLEEHIVIMLIMLAGQPGA